jgi:hypothetical protein
MLATIASVSMIMSGCGETDTSGSNDRTSSSLGATALRASATAKSASSPPTQASRSSDIDGDSDNNDDDYAYGNAASPADRRAVTEMVKRYYTAAAAMDGVKGCSLIYSLLAEEIPELYGEIPDSPQLKGTTCSVVMSKLFKENHSRLVSDAATLQVRSVRVMHNRALVMMSFRSMPQRDILVHREHRTWRIDELLDTKLG